jgi:hypothetical protein
MLKRLLSIFKKKGKCYRCCYNTGDHCSNWRMCYDGELYVALEQAPQLIEKLMRDERINDENTN